MSEIKYNVIFSRRRSLSIIVSPVKGITVRAPFRTSMDSIEKYVREKSAWIEKHMQRFSGLKRISRLQFTDGETHLFLGHEMTLKILPAERPFVRLTDNYIESGIKNPGDRREINIIMGKWYREKTREVLFNRLNNILVTYRQYGFNPSGFTIRTLKSRWGSCSSKGKITFNSQLIKLSGIYIDYVIVHELCHLKHHNHSKDFYKLLGEIIPDYKSIRKDLRDYLMS